MEESSFSILIKEELLDTIDKVNEKNNNLYKLNGKLIKKVNALRAHNARLIYKIKLLQKIIRNNNINLKPTLMNTDIDEEECNAILSEIYKLNNEINKIKDSDK